jgi:hypothetical protein
MIFGSIARADEIKVPISVSTSEPTNLEIIIKAPLTETKKADSPPLQEKTSQLEEKELGTECNLGTQCNECLTFSGDRGRCMRIGNIPCAYCKPCEVRALCNCTTPEVPSGNWVPMPGGGGQCLPCGSYQ